jgi:hypothetical protein
MKGEIIYKYKTQQILKNLFIVYIQKGELFFYEIIKEAVKKKVCEYN